MLALALWPSRPSSSPPFFFLLCGGVPASPLFEGAPSLVLNSLALACLVFCLNRNKRKKEKKTFPPSPPKNKIKYYKPTNNLQINSYSLWRSRRACQSGTAGYRCAGFRINKLYISSIRSTESSLNASISAASSPFSVVDHQRGLGVD